MTLRNFLQASIWPDPVEPEVNFGRFEGLFFDIRYTDAPFGLIDTLSLAGVSNLPTKISPSRVNDRSTGV